MLARRWKSWIFVALGCLLASPMVMAESASVPPLPKRRPPLESDQVNLDPAIQPVLSKNEIKTNPNALTETDSEKAARVQRNSEMLLRDQARAEAESAALAAEAQVTRAFISASDMEALATTWLKKSNAAKSDWEKAQRNITIQESALDQLLTKLNPESSILERSRVADLKAERLRELMNAASYKYLFRDLNMKALDSRVIALQSRITALNAQLNAAVARSKADSFREDFRPDGNKEKKIKESITPVQTEHEKVARELRDALSFKTSASEAFYKYKAEFDTATASAAVVAKAVRSKQDLDAQMAVIRGQITSADQLAIQVFREIKNAPTNSGLEQAKARVRIAKIRAKAGSLRQSALAIFSSAAKANQSAEDLVAPLTPQLQAAILQKAAKFSREIENLVNENKKWAEQSQRLLMTAEARLQIVQTAWDAKEKARSALQAKYPSQLELQEGLRQEEGARKAVFAMAETKASEIEISQLRAQLARAKAKLALARESVAKNEEAFTQASLDLAIALAETEPELLLLLKGSAIDTRGDLQLKLASLRSRLGEMHGRGAKAAEIMQLANVHLQKVLQKVRANFQAEANDQSALRKIQEQEAKIQTVRKNGEALLQKDPHVAGLAAVRAMIGRGREELLQMNIVKIKVAIEAATTKIALYETFLAADESVKQLLPLTPKDPRPLLRQNIAGLRSQLAILTEQAASAHIVVESVENQVKNLKELRLKIIDAKAQLDTKSKELEEYRQKTVSEKKTYDEAVATNIAQDEKAKARVPWDRAKAAQAEVEEKVAELEYQYEQLSYNSAVIVENTLRDVIALYPFAEIDKVKADAAALKAAQEKMQTLATAAKQAQDAVITSRLAVLDIQKKSKAMKAANDKVKTLDEQAVQSQKLADDQAKESQGLLDSAKEELQKIANRIAPTLFSDSQINSYLETKQARARAKVQNAIDTARVHVDESDAQAEALRSEIRAAKDSLKLAQSKLAAAQARYTFEYSKRDGMDAKQLNLAVSNVDLAHDSLSVAEVRLRKSYLDLQRALRELSDDLRGLRGEMQTGQAEASNIQKIDDRLTDIEKENSALVDALAKMDEDARAAMLARLQALAAHGEALASGKLSKLISLDDLADQKAIELDGHLCSRRDTDPITCLACNVVFEARVDNSFDGKLLPARTVMNRLNKNVSRWGDSVCGVVHNRDWVKKNKQWVCEYSWSCEAEDAIAALNKSSTKKTRARYNYFKLSENDREEILAALVAYYETEVPYHMDSYWNSKIVTPYWVDSDCKDKPQKIGQHTACRVEKKVDEQEADEEARMRIRTDDIDPDSVTSH